MRYALLLLLFFLGGWGYDYLSRRYDADEQRWQTIISKIGVTQNTQRIKLGIPVLPDSNWVPQIRMAWDSVGYVSFMNKTNGIDSLPRYAIKQVYFDVPALHPILEVDSYYSGRRFVENDPDYTGWERIVFLYAYKDGYVRAGDYPNRKFEKGKEALFYEAKPQFLTSNTNPAGFYMTMLKERSVSLAQADSVLRAWKSSSTSTKK
jgi:hypothetical protein